jgi:hypothetical protein
METKAGQILKQVLIGNRGKSLTVDEILELSKNEKYSQGHHLYSKTGITEAFVRTRLAIYHNLQADLINDLMFGLVTEIEWTDGQAKTVHISETPKIRKTNYPELTS